MPETPSIEPDDIDDVALAISVEQIDEANKLYRSFPLFEEWGGTSVDQPLWAARVSRFELAKEGRTPEDLARATSATMRLAAIDTGAIEGLYQVDRGFTFSVAFQAAGWEFEMDRRGTQIRPLFEAPQWLRTRPRRRDPNGPAIGSVHPGAS
jgi:hypothetical protein